MLEKYLEIIAELDGQIIHTDAKRSTTFVNSVSQLAYDRYNLNAADNSATQNALIDALDQYFC